MRRISAVENVHLLCSSKSLTDAITCPPTKQNNKRAGMIQILCGGVCYCATTRKTHLASSSSLIFAARIREVMAMHLRYFSRVCKEWGLRVYVIPNDCKCVMVSFTLTDASRLLRTQTPKANVSEENWNTLLISCIHTITSWYRGGLISEPWKHTKHGKCWAVVCFWQLCSLLRRPAWTTQHDLSGLAG